MSAYQLAIVAAGAAAGAQNHPRRAMVCFSSPAPDNGAQGGGGEDQPGPPRGDQTLGEFANILNEWWKEGVTTFFQEMVGSNKVERLKSDQDAFVWAQDQWHDVGRRSC